MEDPVRAHTAHRRHRKKSLGKRIIKYLEMPHLTRRDRDQRLAIIAVVLLLGVYLVILRPLIDAFVSSMRPKQTQVVPVVPAATGKKGPGKK